MKEMLIKYKFLILAVIMMAVCFVYALIAGKEYTCRFDYGKNPEDIDSVTAVIDEGEGIVEILDTYVEGRDVCVRVRSLNPGRTYVDVRDGDEHITLFVLYSHRSGIVTQYDYFGDFTGCNLVQICLALYIAAVLADIIYRYRRSLRENLYRSANIRMCGLIIFLSGCLISSVFNAVFYPHMGLYEILGSYLNLLTSFALFTFPVALIMGILTTISNFRLLAKEGRTWRNTLGIILSIMLCIATVTPNFVSYGLQNAKWIDVHRWTGTGRFIGMFIEYTAGIVVVYFECILVGTIILGIRAARHIPAFDKDYIVIHGCQIRKDGMLTKLLQSRADRAIEFAQMQKKATGKDIVFIPSGGKGSDEVISEADAISNYLVSKGIPESSILIENESVSTYENFRNAKKLIEEQNGKKEPKIAFSTTNYHVFRSGLLASRLGIKAEGIGSPTKSYFWINAFIREFIATVFYEYKDHLIVLAVLMLINIAVNLMIYMSNVVLS